MGVLSQFALKLSNAKYTLDVLEAPWGSGTMQSGRRRTGPALHAALYRLACKNSSQSFVDISLKGTSQSFASQNCDRTPMPVLCHFALAQNRHGSSITGCTQALYWRANTKYTFAVLEPHGVLAQCKSRPTWRRTEPVFVLPGCRFVLVSMQKELAVFCLFKRYLAVFCEPNCDRTPMPVLRHFVLECRVAENRQLTYYYGQSVVKSACSFLLRKNFDSSHQDLDNVIEDPISCVQNFR